MERAIMDPGLLEDLARACEELAQESRVRPAVISWLEAAVELYEGAEIAAQHPGTLRGKANVYMADGLVAQALEWEEWIEGRPEGAPDKVVDPEQQGRHLRLGCYTCSRANVHVLTLGPCCRVEGAGAEDGDRCAKWEGRS